MNEPIISISGIRGIFGESLTSSNIIKFVSAFARYIKGRRIVIGRDGRLYGDLILQLAETVLLMCGYEVINLGIAPTPTISLAVTVLKADGGISITASHNPQEWNGMKFINSKGIFFDASENKKYLTFLNSLSAKGLSYDKIKHTEYYPDFFKYHIEKVLNINFLNLKKIHRRKFKVVADCVNASGSVIIPLLLDELGCRVVKIDCTNSGIFTRKPEPLPENIRRTCSEVKKNKADIGIVVDPDADRLVLITEEGKPFGEENTIVTSINNVLKNSDENKRIAVVNLSTTRAVDDVVKNYNGKLFKSPVGEINVIREMQKRKAVIGGEGSGGVILPEIHYGRDSLVGITLILNELADFGGKLSEYKNHLPQYHIKKTNLQIKNTNLETIISKLIKKYSNKKINIQDGLRIDFEDAWINFRKSNTEPIMRVICEAKSVKEADKLIKSFTTEINNIINR